MSAARRLAPSSSVSGVHFWFLRGLSGVGRPHVTLRAGKSWRRTGVKFQGLERGAVGVPSSVARKRGWAPR